MCTQCTLQISSNVQMFMYIIKYNVHVQVRVGCMYTFTFCLYITVCDTLINFALAVSCNTEHAYIHVHV